MSSFLVKKPTILPPSCLSPAWVAAYRKVRGDTVHLLLGVGSAGPSSMSDEPLDKRQDLLLVAAVSFTVQVRVRDTPRLATCRAVLCTRGQRVRCQVDSGAPGVGGGRLLYGQHTWMELATRGETPEDGQVGSVLCSLGQF